MTDIRILKSMFLLVLKTKLSSADAQYNTATINTNVIVEHTGKVIFPSSLKGWSQLNKLGNIFQNGPTPCLPKKTVVVEFKQWDWIEVTMTNHPLPRWEKFLFLSMCSWYFDLIIYLILKVTWLSHGMFKSSCNISVEYFPFDIQVISKFQFYFVICKVIFLSTCWIWYSNNETWNCRMFRKSWFGQNDTNVW